VEERDWNRLVQQLHDGECTPFIGSGACVGTLPTGRRLALEFAEEYGYPFADPDNLARVMQFVAAEVGDPVSLKRQLARRIDQHQAPDFNRSTEPHGLLASLPLPLYLTTNYDSFMTEALRQRQRHPADPAICRWHPVVPGETPQPALKPQVGAPLVFHLHGATSDPASMVLTEDDYLSFLLTLALDQGFDDRRVIPSSILPALTRMPLLFIGYSLQDWTFRLLFHGFRRLLAGFNQRRHISVQLMEPLVDDAVATKAQAEDYLRRHFDQWNISVYWGEAGSFCEELRERLGSVNAV
jgi:hypothetical protein